MATEQLFPTGELSDVGLVANDHTDHNADPDVDATVVAATGNNVETEWGGTFDTPTDSLTVGTDLQEFRAGVDEFDSGQTGVPQARIELWEAGSMVRQMVAVNVEAPTVLSFPWNASELADVTGADVQMKVFSTKSGGAPGARNTINIGNFEWNVDYTPTVVPVILPIFNQRGNSLNLR